MVRSLSVEVTFVGVGSPLDSSAEGVVRMPDGTLRTFSGWLDLLAALEHVITGAHHQEDR